jgi:iron complex outermembrane recepter protein
MTGFLRWIRRAWSVECRLRRRHSQRNRLNIRTVAIRTIALTLSATGLLSPQLSFSDESPGVVSLEYLNTLDSPYGSDVVEETEFGSIRLTMMRSFQDAAPLQPLPTAPTTQAPNTSPSAAADAAVASIFRGNAPRSSLPTSRLERVPRQQVAADRILGIESRARSTSDVGSLLSKSSQNRGVVAQKRSPIITDPRIRGSRVGQIGAAGSYWVPARIDLDTALSKIDSRIIQDVDVVKGPYAVQYGPGTEFLSFNLLTSPRSSTGPDIGGSSSLNYQTNGEQWYGRQTIDYADADWGARVGYGHRTGSDYEAGNGEQIPSSYKSRDFDVAVGYDIAAGQTIEMFYLHQDQSNLELPGQAFDIDSLITNAFEVTWSNESVDWADRIEVEAWYNESQLKGNAQSLAKRRTFPFLNALRFNGVTDVESASIGARSQAVWEMEEARDVTAGIDFRLIRQELDEISSGAFGFNFWNDRNSPIPRSAAANPGLFIEFTDDTIDGVHLAAGIRTDVTTTEVLADASSLQDLGTGFQPLTMGEILGTSDFDQSFGLWSGFVSADVEVDENWTLHAAAGHGMRTPSLTELYAAESFMFLMQSGLNTVTGDPRLNPERRWQIDLGADYADDNFRASVNGFHAWVHDRITFENTNVVFGPPFGQVEQVNLRYVNTDRAVLYGFEGDAEYFLADGVSLFGTLLYVRGTDETRNGSFATLAADGTTGGGNNASQRIAGLERGFFTSNTTGAGTPSQEALPGIAPLESRLGTRVNGDWGDVVWNVELSARIVDAQNQVARTLLESTTPGFTTYDLRSFWNVSDNLTLVAGVENLTDKDYREHFDFRSTNGQSVRQPGRNFYFGTELTY